MSHTLVLNADGSPLSVVPISTLHWQEAVKLVFLDRADILAYYENWVVHSPSMELQVPSVLMLREFVKVSRAVRFSRANVLLRDEYRCQYCNLDAQHDHSLLTLDHVTPRFHGGKTKWDNIVSACMSCNLEKSHHTHMKPMHEARRPSYYELVSKRQKFPIWVPDPAWGEFMGWPSELVKIGKVKNDNGEFNGLAAQTQKPSK